MERQNNNEKKQRSYRQTGRLYGLAGNNSRFEEFKTSLDTRQDERIEFLITKASNLTKEAKELNRVVKEEYLKSILSSSQAIGREHDEVLKRITTLKSVGTLLSDGEDDKEKKIIADVLSALSELSKALSTLKREVLEQINKIGLGDDYAARDKKVDDFFKEYSELLSTSEKNRQELIDGYREGEAIRKAFGDNSSDADTTKTDKRQDKSDPKATDKERRA